ncbi:MAG: hypothetical protein JJ913_06385 [Rhizobiaceae bacterium]|nr:hypothetical protein [Rhizobiaceae bacterium]
MPSPVLDSESLEQLNAVGRTRGCHRCGTRDPGTVSGSFVPEYHPPHAFGGSAAVIIPSCLPCNRSTGALVTMSLHRRI